MVDLSVIIVNYNVKAFLKNSIISIKKATQNLNCEIIVVDNASEDDSVEFLQKNFSDVILIASDKNLGFSKANNIGLRIAKGKYICLMNPDAIAQEDTFYVMIDFFEKHPEAGLAACKVLNSDGSFQLACRRSFPTPWVAFTKIFGLSQLFPKSKLFAKYNLTYLDENQTYEVDAITGAFMFMPRTTYEKIGELDERFFMYGEDLDYCYRVKLSGLKVYYVHSTQIIHFKGESTKRSSIDEIKVFYNAMHLFVEKHFSYGFIFTLMIQIAITLRRIISYIGKNFISLLGAIIDTSLFIILLIIAEKFYINNFGYSGFPDYSIPYVYIYPTLIFLITSYLSKAYSNNEISITKIIISIIINFLIINTLIFFFKDYAFSRGIVLILFGMLIFVLPFWRLLFALFIRKPKKTGKSLFESRTLIIGTNENAIELIKKLKLSKNHYYEIVGLVDKSKKRIGEVINDVPIIGSIDLINKLIDEHRVNQVLFASDFLKYDEMLKIIAANKNSPAHFQLVDNNFIIVGKRDIVELEEIPFVEIEYSISNFANKLIKRLFDLILSFLGLIFVYPFVFIYSKIKKRENILLFLPMVFIGKLSFVGRAMDSNGDQFLGKKGLTGIVQINKNKNLTDEEKNRYEIFYARNQNIWLDIEILIKTLQNYYLK